MGVKCESKSDDGMGWGIGRLTMIERYPCTYARLASWLRAYLFGVLILRASFC